VTASLLTLETLIPAPEPNGTARNNLRSSDPIKNIAEEGVEDDNPDAELPDETKNRIDSKGFYS